MGFIDFLSENVKDTELNNVIEQLYLLWKKSSGIMEADTGITQETENQDKTNDVSSEELAKDASQITLALNKAQESQRNADKFKKQADTDLDTAKKLMQKYTSESGDTSNTVSE